MKGKIGWDGTRKFNNFLLVISKTLNPNHEGILVKCTRNY
jgi:hypothetical protein